MSKLATMLQVGRTFGVRDGMLRLEYELKRGSGLMSWRMRSVQGWDSWALRSVAPGETAEGLLKKRREGTQKVCFRDARSLETGVKEIVGPEGEASVLSEAEKVLAGVLPYFGQLHFDCGFPPRWFQNPVTGSSVSPQEPWTQMRFASPSYGDLKFILEPSRFLFVYPLVRAYALTGDERYPQAFWMALEDWARQSPPMSGPLWICGQECSLRILAWSFALHSFLDSPATTPERTALLFSMVAAHAWRTAQTIGYARSQRSNHLISEGVGLWTAGTLYPELREAQLWRDLGSQLLREAVLDQITPQGASQQHSFNYQRMNLHLLFWTLRLAEISGAELDECIRQRTESAFDFIRSWVDETSGQTPNYGSDDGSLIFPLAASGYRDFRPLLQLGAAVLNRPGLQAGLWDEAALWFGTGPENIRKSEVDSPALSIETGYFRLGDKNSWAMIRAGGYTRRPFQADQLHVDIWWQGINLARDAGTYLYNGPAPWNNGLAASAVHNTVTVDDRDQMRRAGRFLWVDWAQASGRTYSSRNDGCVDRFEGRHEGYRSLGVTHRRTVQWLPDVGWVAVDDVEGSGEHDVRLHWLASDLPFEKQASPFEILFTAGKSQISWNIFASAPAATAVVRAGKLVGNSAFGPATGFNEALLGWDSPTYGQLEPAVSLICHARCALPVRFVTSILTDECCRVERRDEKIVIRRDESGTASEVYRVSIGASLPDATGNGNTKMSVPQI